METAKDIITDALQEILVQASEVPIEAADAQAAIRYMNRFMARIAADGVNLGYTVVSDLGDNITIPDGAVDGLVKNLAVSLAPQYDRVASAELLIAANDGLEAMRRIAVSILPMAYGDNLPRGSGNTGNYSQNDNYYSGDDAQIENESGNYIATELDTELP